MRDWLYVGDHARAFIKVATEGKVGETCNIGSHYKKQNIEVIETICNILDEKMPPAERGIKDRAVVFRQLGLV